MYHPLEPYTCNIPSSSGRSRARSRELLQSRAQAAAAARSASFGNRTPHQHQEPQSTMSSVGVAAVPDQHREVIEKQIERMLVDMDDEASWNFYSEKNGVKAFTKIDDSLTAARGVGHIPYNPRAVWDIIMDVERKHTFDAQLAVGKRLARLDAQTCIDYLEYKAMFIVAGRDFVSLIHWRVLENGTIIIVAQSTEDLALAPLKEPKVVRGQIHIAGWRIVPDADYKGCNVTFMVKTDLKGSIPSRVAGKAASEQPYLIHQITQQLKKDKNLARFDAEGKLVNTINASEGA